MAQHGDFFCVLPFTAIETDGHVAKPCCQYQGSIPLAGYQESPDLISTQKKLLEGQAPLGCNLCESSERHTSTSLRVLYQTFHAELADQIRRDHSTSQLKNVSVVGSNVCNLKCLPCEHGSFIRSQELHKLGFSKYGPSLRKIDNPEAIADLDIEILTLTSGEPLYDKACRLLLETLISRGKSQDIRLDINTNLTRIDQSILEFLADNFSSVLIKGSIDGTGAVNDYLRYPSDWSNIERAVDLILAHGSIDFVVTTALSNLALLRYHDLVRWSLSKGIRNMFISQVESPAVLSCHRFFNAHAADCRDRLLDIANTPNLFDRTRYCLDLCIKLCNNSLDTGPRLADSDLERFLNIHDQERGTDWHAVFNELTLS